MERVRWRVRILVVLLIGWHPGWCEGESRAAAEAPVFVEARAADGKVLRRYEPVFVSRYVDETMGSPVASPARGPLRCPAVRKARGQGKGIR